MESQESAKPYRRLKTAKIWMHGLDLSGESEKLLDEVMVQLNVDDHEAIKAALRFFLHQQKPSTPQSAA
jgi:hypothetical protein